MAAARVVRTHLPRDRESLTGRPSYHKVSAPALRPRNVVDPSGHSLLAKQRVVSGNSQRIEIVRPERLEARRCKPEIETTATRVRRNEPRSITTKPRQERVAGSQHRAIVSAASDGLAPEAISHDRLNPICGLKGTLVLPNAHHRPALLLKSERVLSISLPVTSQLG
jgi:hypothetical protein